MRMHAEHGFRGTVLDLDTGQPVRKVIWFDDTLGEVESCQVDSNGNTIKNAAGDVLTQRLRGRFRFVPAQPRSAPKLRIGAPACAKCGSVLTLLGDDLCPRCKAKDRGQRNKMTAERVSNLLVPRKCEQCSRQAVWAVSDEVDTTPEVARGRTIKGRKYAQLYYSRAATVGRRWYCDFHYKPPRLLDARGEVMQDLDETLRPN